MENPDALPPAAAGFHQPKPWIRWLAVALAVAGWCVSWQLLLVSVGGKANNPFWQVLCGDDAENACDSVLTSPQAYVRISPGADAPKLPVSAFGMGYFAFVALWYLFIGPPTRTRRLWHLLPGLVVLFGAAQSVAYLGIMKYVLGRWCGGCLAAHAINGGLLVLTLAAYPWRGEKGVRNLLCKAPSGPSRQKVPDTFFPAAHPSARLALATALAGGVVFALHLVVTYTGTVLGMLHERTNSYMALLNDPEFILWDFNRQPVVFIPLYDDELFAGPATAPNTVIVFGDFQCSACRQAHETFRKVAEKYPEVVRFASRHYPQDPECNPEPRFRSSGHASACRAARAAEAARLVGGREACLALRTKLWDNQNALPLRPYAQQSAAERRLFEDWAAEMGLDRTAFTAALDAPAVAARVQADIELGNGLGTQAVPVVYVNGKRLRNWSKLETWDVILGGRADAPTPPDSPPRSE